MEEERRLRRQIGLWDDTCRGEGRQGAAETTVPAQVAAEFVLGKYRDDRGRRRPSSIDLLLILSARTAHGVTG